MKRPRTWKLLLRIAMSGALLALLFWQLPDFDVDELFADWTGNAWAWLIGSGALMLGAFGLQTLRWQQVLVALGLRSSMGRLFSYFMAGQFVSNILPTTIGGDVVRILRLAKDNDDPPASFASVVLERLTGWFVLPMIALLGFLLNPSLLRLGAASWTALAICGTTLLALTAILAIANHPGWGPRLSHRGGWRAFLGAVHFGVVAIRTHRSALVMIIGVGAAFQIVLALSVWMAARALAMDSVGVTAVLAFFPAVAIAQNLPVGIGGLGVREGALVLFLTPLGATDEQAIALGLTFYFVTLVVSLLGGPAFVFGRQAEEQEAAVAGDVEDLAEELERRSGVPHEDAAQIRPDGPDGPGGPDTPYS